MCMSVCAEVNSGLRSHLRLRDFSTRSTATAPVQCAGAFLVPLRLESGEDLIPSAADVSVNLFDFDDPPASRIRHRPNHTQH